MATETLGRQAYQNVLSFILDQKVFHGGSVNDKSNKNNNNNTDITAPKTEEHRYGFRLRYLPNLPDGPLL